MTESEQLVAETVNTYTKNEPNPEGTENRPKT